MSSIIRTMSEKDKSAVLEMMREFYSSPAVYTGGSEEIFKNDIENCVDTDFPFVHGYIIEDNGEIQGYSMIAKSYSTEFGKTCIWIEDLYIKEEYRGLGLGKQFMDFVMNRYADCIFRLEVEAENEGAVRLYEKCGFSRLPYMEMKK
ncbi:MAG: GNAT family N-acetyltransferase [Ruminococcaceae bacterium]|nr:GNAT family N-acetyltransferase [Oscillospiraceae bacterium]